MQPPVVGSEAYGALLTLSALVFQPLQFAIPTYLLACGRPSKDGHLRRCAIAYAGIAAFNVADLSSSQAADALSALGFAVRGGLHCAPGAHRFLGTLRRGAVRASVGHATTFEEIDRFVQAVRSLA